MPAFEEELRFEQPLDFAASLEYLVGRGIPGVEVATRGVYRRTVRTVEGPAVLELERREAGFLALRLFPARSVPAELLACTRRQFGLDGRPALVSSALGTDPLLRPLLLRRPGLRVTGGFEPFELAVRAILGQQVSVPGATTLSGRLVARFGDELGEPVRGVTHLFPRADRLAAADVASIGIPAARGETIRRLAAAVADGLWLGPGDLAALRSALLELRGIGPWTAEYVAMRAGGDPDAFPASDLGLRQALGNGRPASAQEVAAAGEAWRPWRAYAAMHLWQGLADGVVG